MIIIPNVQNTMGKRTEDHRLDVRGSSLGSLAVWGGLSGMHSPLYRIPLRGTCWERVIENHHQWSQRLWEQPSRPRRMSSRRSVEQLCWTQKPQIGMLTTKFWTGLNRAPRGTWDFGPEGLGSSAVLSQSPESVQDSRCLEFSWLDFPRLLAGSLCSWVCVRMVAWLSPLKVNPLELQEL